MTGQSRSQSDGAPPEPQTGLAGRLPSASWEALPLADSPQHSVWVWFKPQNVPQGLVVTIPDETFRDYPHPDQLTMRKLLQTAGVEPGCVSMWYLYGVAYDGMNGTTPLLDAAIPQPGAEADPTIVIYTNVPHVDAVQHAPAPAPASAPASAADVASLSEVFRRIDVDWRASVELEKELTILRRKLMDMSGRLKTLNRELSPDERLYSSTQDKKDWLAARRWLRDSAAQLSRYIREHDIGDTSSAGQREWFEKTYRQFILPRQQFDGIRQAQRDYGSYRKMVEKLQSNMKTAYSSAAENGERRAQQVLSGIAAKVRAATTKKNFLGVMLD